MRPRAYRKPPLTSLIKYVKYAKFMILKRKIGMKRRLLATMASDDAATAIRTFAAAVEGSSDLQQRLSQARAWYGVKDAAGQWAFAPSKWVGFSRMTAERYLDQHDGIDGRQTEKRLNEWFSILPEDSDLHATLFKQLSEFLGEYGKQPSSAARISIINGDEITSDDDKDAAVTRLIVALLGKIRPEHRNEIRKSLRTFTKG